MEQQMQGIGCFRNWLAATEGANLTVRKDYLLAEAASFAIGGVAALALWPRTVGMMCETLRMLRACGVPYMIVGNASNLLFDDTGFRGAVVFTTKLNQLAVSGCTLTAGAGVSLTTLSSAASRHGLTGLEFAYGIPGSCGGAVYMNAGAFEGCMGDVVSSVTAYDTEADQVHVYDAQALDFSYRHSRFTNGKELILSVTVTLRPGDPATITKLMEEHLAYRKSRQPLNFPSAGSVFKRYPGYYTSRLIEEAGLKGRTVGGAQVSEKHAGFIINRGGATAADVRALIEVIRGEIFEKYGIHIECEIVFAGTGEENGEA